MSNKNINIYKKEFKMPRHGEKVAESDSGNSEKLDELSQKVKELMIKSETQERRLDELQALADRRLKEVTEFNKMLLAKIEGKELSPEPPNSLFFAQVVVPTLKNS